MGRTMTIQPTTENRTDSAARHFELEDAPILMDERYRFRTGAVEYRWRPTHAELRWRNGVPQSIRLNGFRLKKDSELGKIKESRSLKIEEGRVVPPQSVKMDVRWLQSLLELFGTVPAFTPMDRPTWSQTETPYVETTIIVPADAV